MQRAVGDYAGRKDPSLLMIVAVVAVMLLPVMAAVSPVTTLVSRLLGAVALVSFITIPLSLDRIPLLTSSKSTPPVLKDVASGSAGVAAELEDGAAGPGRPMDELVAVVVRNHLARAQVADVAQLQHPLD
jgi:hypothetical protein